MTGTRHAWRTTLFSVILASGLTVGGAVGPAAADTGESGVSTGNSSSEPGPSTEPAGSGVRTQASDDAGSGSGAGATTRRPSVRPTQQKPPRTNVRPVPSRPTAAPVTPQRTEDPPPAPVVFGRPEQNVQYWAARDWDTHNLMTATMVMRQLTGRMQDPQEFVDEAKRTDSTYREGRTMYLGEDVGDTVWREDAMELLAGAGVEVTARMYPNSQQQRALDDLKTALQDPQKAVLVNIADSAVGWAGSQVHTVVVLGIDATNNVVYLNDAALPSNGRGMAMSLDRFLAAWSSNHRTVIAQLRRPAVTG